jgi:tripartite-type tricarboxylate transporter receptor subunit TctC
MRRMTVAALILFAGVRAAAAQDWPTTPVKIVVPFAAGATPDIVARLIADRLHDKLARTFIVENRPGASGNIGTEAVAKAAPDGATIGVSIGGPLAINTLLFGKLPYDPRKEPCVDHASGHATERARGQRCSRRGQHTRID